MNIQKKPNFNFEMIVSLLLCLALAIGLLKYTALDAVFTFLFFFTLWNKKQENALDVFNLRPSSFNYAIGLFLISYAMGYFLSSPMETKQWEEIAALRWILGFYCSFSLGYLLAKRNGTTDLSSPFLLGASLLVIAKHYHDGMAIGLGDRLAGFYSNPNHLALAALLPFSFYLGHVATQKLNRLKTTSLLLTLTVLLVVIFSTFSRGALFSLIVAGLLAFAYTKNKKISAAISAIVLIILCLFSLNIFKLKDRFLYALNWSDNTSQGLRIAVWKVNWAIFKDHPLFGVGMEEAARMYGPYYEKLGLPLALRVGNAHNQYFQVLAGAGIIGLLSYLFVFIGGYIFFHRKYISSTSPAKRSVALGALLTISSLMLCSTVDSPFSLQEVRNYVLLILGFSYGYLIEESA